MSGEGKKPKAKPELTVDDVKIISNTLYQAQWTGPEWQKRIIPLINKLAEIANGKK